MLRLGEIKNSEGATHRRKRLGRGSGTGRGGTAGKGNKGQLARTGGRVRIGFEGGQMPLYRRVPKKGFTNIFRIETEVVSLADVMALGLAEVTIDALRSARLVSGSKDVRIKILSDGEVKKKVTVEAHAFSAAAKDKIEKAGGQVVLCKK